MKLREVIHNYKLNQRAVYEWLNSYNYIQKVKDGYLATNMGQSILGLTSMPVEAVDKSTGEVLFFRQINIDNHKVERFVSFFLDNNPSNPYGTAFSYFTDMREGYPIALCPDCNALRFIANNKIVCSRQSCGAVEKLCPNCGRVLQRIRYKDRVFLGCPGFKLKAKDCSYTESLS